MAWRVTQWSCFFALLATLIGCAKRDDYSQDTPDDTVKSAVAMIRDGRADKLTNLIYPESPEFNAILLRLSALLGTLQGLATDLQDRFPAEIAALREASVKEAAGKAGTSLMTALTRGGPPPPGPAGQTEQRALEDAFGRLIADPFGWVETNAARLTTVTIADDTAAVLLDGMPIPPLGLAMKRVQGRWYVQVPLNFPGAAQFMPQTRQEWSIIASLIKVIDHAVQDLRADVRSGEIASTKQLATKVGEKAFIPAAMVFVVYSKEMDVRRRRERVMNDYRKAQAAWVARRIELGADADAMGRLAQALPALAVEAVDKTLRQDSLRPNRQAPRATPAFADMAPEAFETLAQSWIQERGWKDALGSLTAASELDALAKKIRPPVDQGG